MDTALVLQLQVALERITTQLNTHIANLAVLTNTHRHTVMAGRTHSQQAAPTTFGLKTAGWLAPLLRHRERLIQLQPRVLVVQLGGSGNLVINTDQMQANVRASLGLMLAERLNFALAEVMSRSEAKRLIREAGIVALRDHKHLVDVLRERVTVSLDWETLRDEATYLGISEALINGVLNAARKP